MDYTIYDFIGNVGVALIIGTYLLLQLNKIKSMQFSYSALNALGALLIIISLTNDFNLSAFVVELFWIMISLVGITRNWIKNSA
jgi:hypothetical protein